MLLSQIIIHGLGVGNLAILIVIIAAVVALVLVACRQFGVTVPG